MSNSADSVVTPEALASMLSGLLASVELENKAAFQAWADLPMTVRGLEALQQGNLEHFRLLALRPFEKFADGLASHVAPASRQAQFLIKHSDFVESHFRDVIDKREGMACCADKSRWIVRVLYRHFSEGKPIVLNYEQEYTYHLPRKVFNSEEVILEFFQAVYSLFYGRGEPFAKLRMALAVEA